MKKILFIFGTRPEAIKVAPLIRLMQKAEDFMPVICVTAQHRHMLDQVLQLFELKPDYDLDVMKPNQDLFDITSSVLVGLRAVIEKEKPAMTIVQGDTTTCFAGALASFYARVPVAHVEAGLRTYDLASPFPEEANRALTTRISTLHFAPTEMSKSHLLQEHVPDNTIDVTGNTVIDALLWVRDQVALQGSPSALSSLRAIIESDQPIILITAHRRESFGSGFQRICEALAQLAQRHPKWHWVYPVHLNPNVQKPVREHLSSLSNVHLIEPLDYAPFVYLMNKAKLIITDSGGVQEEAPSLGKPVLVLRETTERPEAVLAGTVILVGTDVNRIVAETESLLLDASRYQAMTRIHNPYGDGHASERIIKRIRNYLYEH